MTVYSDIATLRKNDPELYYEMLRAQEYMYLNRWINVRNALLKYIRDSYDLNYDAIMEIRRMAGLKNGVTKGYSLKKHTEKLRQWSPKFDEEYNMRLMNYDEYNRRVQTGKTEWSDWEYERQNNRIDYAQELTRDLIKIMKNVMDFEFDIANYVCEKGEI